MNAYVFSGWIVAMAGTALYAGWTIITSRRIAAQVLAVKGALTIDSGAEGNAVLEGNAPLGGIDHE